MERKSKKRFVRLSPEGVHYIAKNAEMLAYLQRIVEEMPVSIELVGNSALDFLDAIVSLDGDGDYDAIINLDAQHTGRNSAAVKRNYEKNPSGLLKRLVHPFHDDVEVDRHGTGEDYCLCVKYRAESEERRVCVRFWDERSTRDIW